MLINFLKNNISTILILTLSISNFILVFNINILKDENALLKIELNTKHLASEIAKADLNECNFKLFKQNRELKELETSKPDIKKIRQEVEAKYKKLKSPNDKTCENKLKHYESLFKELSK